jgi:hypothetical protein
LGSGRFRPSSDGGMVQSPAAQASYAASETALMFGAGLRAPLLELIDIGLDRSDFSFGGSVGDGLGGLGSN